MAERLEDKLLIDLGQGRVATLFVRVWKPDGPVRGTVFCIHGFTDNGSNFDYLAGFLARIGYMVVCPDMLGRGQSSYLRDPEQYGFELFIHCIAALGRYGGKNNVFIGSSWGASIVLLFLRTTGTIASKVVLNDLCLTSGPVLDSFCDILPPECLMTFADLAEARDYLMRSREWLAEAEEPQIADYVRNRVIAEGDRLRLAYDPALVDRMTANRGKSFDVYPMLAQLRTPTLLLYGRQSPMLEPAILGALKAENPSIEVVSEIAAGHPPLLLTLNEALVISGYIAAA